MLKKESEKMSAYDIIQLIIAILSLAATIVISVVLYKLDRKRERQIEEQNEKTRQLNLEHEAEIFIIKNGDEIEFLPLCVVANNLNRTIKHRRAIYNNFNLCSDELKEIILQKQDIYLKKISTMDWFSSCVDKFIAKIEELDLGLNMYYDDAKYIKRCFSDYGKKELPDIHLLLDFQSYDIRDNKLQPNGIYKCGLSMYLHQYFNYLYDIAHFENPEDISYLKPCNAVYKATKNTEEDIYCYWCANQMRWLCSKIREIGCQNSFYMNSYSQAIELNEKYFEDIYYCAIYELYLTFGKENEVK